MQVTMGRKLRTGNYEMIEMSVTIEEHDVAEGDNYSARMQLKAYAQILAFEVFHGHRSAEQARAEVLRFKEAYKLIPAPDDV